MELLLQHGAEPSLIDKEGEYGRCDDDSGDVSKPCYKGAEGEAADGSKDEL